MRAAIRIMRPERQALPDVREHRHRQRDPAVVEPVGAVFGGELEDDWLITPHSGLSMKRIERMVGIDGTAHGRMNSTDSHLIHGRAVTKKPDR